VAALEDVSLTKIRYAFLTPPSYSYSPRFYSFH